MFLRFPFRSLPFIAKLLHPPFLKQKSYSKMKAIAVIFWERTSRHPESPSLRWKLYLKMMQYYVCRFGLHFTSFAMNRKQNATMEILDNKSPILV